MRHDHFLYKEMMWLIMRLKVSYGQTPQSLHTSLMQEHLGYYTWQKRHVLIVHQYMVSGMQNKRDLGIERRNDHLCYKVSNQVVSDHIPCHQIDPHENYEQRNYH